MNASGSSLWFSQSENFHPFPIASDLSPYYTIMRTTTVKIDSNNRTTMNVVNNVDTTMLFSENP